MALESRPVKDKQKAAGGGGHMDSPSKSGIEDVEV